jgi:nitrogen fixation-related uncharacterized protein
MEEVLGAAIVIGFLIAIYMWWFQKGRFQRHDDDDFDPTRW